MSKPEGRSDTNEPLYDVLFEGRFVVGRNPAEVEAAIEKRFGNVAAQRIFAGGAVRLKRGVSRGSAEKIRATLEKIGLITRINLSETMPVESLSLAEDAAPPAHAESIDSSASNVSLEAASQFTVVERPAVPADSGGVVEKNPVPENTFQPVAPPAGPTVSSESIGKNEVDALFGGELLLPAASRMYALALLPVALSMLLLPLVYLLVVVACAYGVYWHATNGLAWIDTFSYSGRYAIVFLYGVPLFAGTLLFVFLLKPLIAEHEYRPQPVRLDAKREPALFHLINRIAELAGAPKPTEIHVDVSANASAQLSRGILSRQLTLTIGMPLIYGMSIQALSGVIAHELGHFSQRAGLRFGLAVNRINYWLYVRARQKDSWDDLISGLQRSDTGVLIFTGFLASMGAGLCRMLFRGLSWLGAVFSFSLSRQMEFDADRYEIALSGSRQYARTCEAILVLNFGTAIALDTVKAELDGQRVIGNVPELVSEAASQLTPEQRREIMRGIKAVNRSVFDTHPPDKERIARARDADQEGILASAEPARGLVRELDRLSRMATLQWYRYHDLDFDPEHVGLN